MTPLGELTLELKLFVPAALSTFSLGRSSLRTSLRRHRGRRSFTVPSLDFKPRVGDGYRIEMQPPEGDPFYLIGEFLEDVPPARVVFTFVYEDPDPRCRDPSELRFGSSTIA